MSAPADLSAHLDVPLGEVADLLSREVLRGAAEADLRRAGALLFDRTLWLLRRGPRDQVLEECLDLERFLGSEAGKCVTASHLRSPAEAGRIVMGKPYSVWEAATRYVDAVLAACQASRQWTSSSCHIAAWVDPCQNPEDETPCVRFWGRRDENWCQICRDGEPGQALREVRRLQGRERTAKATLLRVCERKRRGPRP